MDEQAAVAASIGAGVLVFYAIFFIVWVVTVVMIIKDSGKYSEQAWAMSGQNKVLWIILSIIIAWPILFLIYWFAIRSKVIAAQAQLDSGGGY